MALRKRAKDSTTGATPAEENPQLLVDQPKASKWRKAWTRFWATWMMVAGMYAIIFYGKHQGLILFILTAQLAVYNELLALVVEAEEERELPGFRRFYWWWLFVGLYFCYGVILHPHFAGGQAISARLLGPAIPQFVIANHALVSFCLYCAGFVAFVASLRRGRYSYQYRVFAFCHVVLVLIVGSTSFMVSNILNGIIWFVLPSSMIVVNDVFAYCCGFLLGRTPLIKLSPKKTWEGFIGGALFTLVWAFYASRWMSSSPLFICPKVGFAFDFVAACPRTALFTDAPLASYAIMEPLKEALPDWLAAQPVMPVQGHALVLACFASLVAPFSGFFASGFKRATGIKDYGQLLPGHGGLTDRFDCQVPMGTFMFVYAATYLRAAAPELPRLINSLLALPPDAQLQAYEALKGSLAAAGLLS